MIVGVLSGWSLVLVVSGTGVLAASLYAGFAVAMAVRLGDQVAEAAADMRVVCAQTAGLDGGIDKVNESVVRIHEAVRTLRKAVVDE